MASQWLLKNSLKAFFDKFPNSKYKEQFEQPNVWIPADELSAVFDFLKNQAEYPMEMLVDITAVDYLSSDYAEKPNNTGREEDLYSETRFDLVYHLAAYVPHKVGLIYLDAHADINIPETTLSGMYGGMDVALAAGLFNHRNRLIHGLDPPLPPNYIVLGDVRDTDPREAELINRLQVEILTTHDIRHLTQNIQKQMERLSRLTDLIYIHVDMDVLAPEEVRGHGLTAPDGPTSQELAACIELMFTYPKAAAIGIASTPYGPRDPDHLSRQAAIRLIAGAVKGVKKRN